jgi:hypothetical protein
MVLNSKCKECNDICYAKYFQSNFLNWTSGNSDIDKFIKNTQLSAHYDVGEALEWIPNNRLYNIKSITINKYIANWIDGYIIDWNNKTQNWARESQNMIVKLKKLNDLKNISIDEVW